MERSLHPVTIPLFLRIRNLGAGVEGGTCRDDICIRETQQETDAILMLGYFEESLITHKVLKNHRDRNSVVSPGLVMRLHYHP